jgi:FKBP-type peptidyl-prolyl cis-trans isomerase 2
MIKKGDFVKVEYTGYLEDGTIFDTTKEEEAKKGKIYKQNVRYGPILMIVGSGRMIPGLEKAVEGMEIGAEKSITLNPSEAFGQRDADLINVIPFSQFEREDINPVPGMVVTIDNKDGVVRSVGGGRVIVDFNHPLAGQTVKYTIKTIALLENISDKAKALVEDAGVDGEVTVENDTLTIKTKADPSYEYMSRKYALLMNVKDFLQDIKHLKFNEDYTITEKKPKKEIKAETAETEKSQ